MVSLSSSLKIAQKVILLILFAQAVKPAATENIIATQSLNQGLDIPGIGSRLTFYMHAIKEIWGVSPIF